MHENIVKIGRPWIVTILTLVSIIASLIISYLACYYTQRPFGFFEFSVSAGIPLLIAPTVTWYIVGLLIKIHKMESDMRQLANFDMVTGMMSRRAFLTHYSSVFHAIARNQSSLTFIYIDIDNFKQINDRYGHAAGDEVLKSFSEILNLCKRKSDLAGRIGGEEFALALPDTNQQGAIKFAEKIRKIASKDSVELQNHSINYSVSIGLATYSRNQQTTAPELMALADKALYDAKSQGKNCVAEYSDNQDIECSLLP